ncbi:MAG: acetylxylan esterase [Fimbriimonadaceae bacterium]
MPLIDMPLAELEVYPGINPRPDDFDSYWDRAMDEMRGVQPEVLIRPVASPARFAECAELWWTGVRGARIFAKLVRPANRPKPGPAVLMFHGYAMASGDWTTAYGLAAQGFTVAMMDCRGQGGRSEDLGGSTGTTHSGQIVRGLASPDPQDLLFRHIFLDTAQLASIVMGLDGVDPERVGAMGASQGGGLTLACAALVPGLRRAAPTYPFLCDYRRVWDLDLAKDAYGELRTYLRNFDPRHDRVDEMWTRLGYIDCRHLAPRIRAEVLMFVGLMDPITPPSTQFAAYNAITSRKEVVVYPDYGHEPLPGSSDRAFAFMSGMLEG